MEIVILAEISIFAAKNVRLQAGNGGVLGAIGFWAKNGGKNLQKCAKMRAFCALLRTSARFLRSFERFFARVF